MSHLCQSDPPLSIRSLSSKILNSYAGTSTLTIHELCKFLLRWSACGFSRDLLFKHWVLFILGGNHVVACLNAPPYISRQSSELPGYCPQYGWKSDKSTRSRNSLILDETSQQSHVGVMWVTQAQSNASSISAYLCGLYACVCLWINWKNR